ncbi:hypothetical protein SNEBB_000754, partial [Seison nebaliae]
IVEHRKSTKVVKTLISFGFRHKNDSHRFCGQSAASRASFGSNIFEFVP